MKILFAGSPAIAVPSLESISGINGIFLAGVLTNPDSSKGRHGRLQQTDIGNAAEILQNKQSFPVLKPLKLDAGVREIISSLEPDLLVSFAYGRIFGPKFLALFPLGGINIHPSLLPKYRGPSPIQAAILNRDTITGISIQKISEKMDQGDIYISRKIQLKGNETADSLSDITAKMAAEMLPDVLLKIAAGTASATEQNHEAASYCPLITKDDGIINWKQSVLEIEAKIRGFFPWPLCRTVHNGRELSILKADVYNGIFASKDPEIPDCPGTVLGIDKNNGILIQTGNGILAAVELQYQAKKALHWRDFLNGARDFTQGQILGAD